MIKGLPDAEALAKRAAKSSGGEAEVFCELGRGISASAESGAFSDISEEEKSGFGVRIVLRGRAGFSFGNDVSKFDAVVAQAVALSKFGTILPRLPGGAEKYARVPGAFDKKIDALEGRDLLGRLKGMVDEMRTLRDVGVRPTWAGIEATTSREAVANSLGAYMEFSYTEIGGGAYASCGEGSTGFEGKESRKNDLDFESFGRIAADRAVEGRNPQKIEGVKAARILLEPQAVSGLLSNTLLPAIDGENVLHANSRLAGKIGRKVFAANLDITDDGLLKGGLGSFPGDSEGVPCAKTQVVSKGILKSFLYDWETAMQAKAKPTGNGFRGFSGRPSISPTNIVIGRGSAKRDDMLSEGGLFLVHWLSGTHTTNPFSGEFSVEMKNSFLVGKDGGKTPVKYGLIVGNIFDVLADEVVVARDCVEKAKSFVTGPVMLRADVVA